MNAFFEYLGLSEKQTRVTLKVAEKKAKGTLSAPKKKNLSAPQIIHTQLLLSVCTFIGSHDSVFNRQYNLRRKFTKLMGSKCNMVSKTCISHPSLMVSTLFLLAGDYLSITQNTSVSNVT